MLKNLDEIEDKTHFGSKAYYLGALARAGFRIPQGFAIRRGYNGEIDSLRFAAWAVRSSATDEDQEHFSKAGYYKSYLNVESVAEALEKCFGENAIENAIAQEMIIAEYGGVCVSSSIENSNQVAVEVCLGHNAGVTQGRKEVARVAINGNQVSVVCDPCRILPSIDPRHLLELARSARMLEQKWGFAVDIEWCVRDGDLYYLQARPITGQSTLASLESIKTATQQGLKADVKAHGWGLWTDFSVGDMFPKPSRLFLDFMNDDAGPNWPIRRVFRDLGLAPASKLSGPLFVSICDRAYIHVANYFGLLFPGSALRLRAIQSWTQTLSHAARCLFVVPFRVRALRRRIKTDFSDTKLTELQAKARELARVDVSKLSLAELRVHRESIQSPLDEAIYAHVMCDVLAGASQMWARLLLRARFGSKAAQIESELLTGLSGNLNTETTLALFDVAQGRLTLEELVDRLGHRGTPDWDLSSRRWREDPTQVQRMVAALKESGADPWANFLKQVALRERAEYRMRKHRFILRQVSYVQTLSPLRERTQGVVYGFIEALRNVIVDVGRRTRLNDDIFWLTKTEFENLWKENSSITDLQGKAAKRRIEAALSRRIHLPHVFSDRDVSDKLFEPIEIAEGETTLKGTSASLGVACGRARVVEDLKELVELNRNDIVVTKFADPAYASLLLTGGGLVLEQGSVYSHMAIVAREFGLPAIVNVKDATRKIVDGQAVRLDGKSGELTLGNSLL